MLTYIPITAIQVGVPENFAFYFIAIANGSSAFGRISAGLLADRLGVCMQVDIVLTLVLIHD